MFTDIVGSTRLLSALGDLAGNRRILEHHGHAARVLREVGGGELINTGGDSIFLAFEHPRTAVRFALRLQRELREWMRGEPVALRIRDRVGIHFGEVEEGRRPDGALDLTGFAVSFAASIMDLAGPDQILLSSEAFDAARAAPREDDLAEFPNLRWISHGHYHIKGLESPVPIFEVGEEGVSPLQAPPHGDADHLPEDDLTGWRPAIGSTVPGTRWVIDRFLGSSGFGEVWLAHDAASGVPRALRFCFRPSRVRALREARPLFERIRTGIGDHPHIARLHRYQFDHTPPFLENDYAPGVTLTELCRMSGGAAAVDETHRLEIIAQVAEALDAAHRAGVVHGDLRPDAVMVQPADAGHPLPGVKLIEFGTARLVAAELAAEQAVSRSAVESTRPGFNPSGGAPLYWAPELFRGDEPSPASDIYALGVLLYQALVCDLTQPVTIDVARRIRDPLLLDDLLACLATDPAARLPSAGELASRLRRLPERRRDLERRERRSYFQGVLRTAAVAAVIVGLTGWLAWRAQIQQRAAETAQLAAETNAVQLRVVNAFRLFEEGDLPNSLQQLIEALKLDTRDPARDRELIHRRRIGSILRAAPRQLSEWRLGERGVLLALHPSGEWIAAGTASGLVRAWSVSTGRRVGEDIKLGGPTSSLDWTPDGGTLFAHVERGPVLLWTWSGQGATSEPLRLVEVAEAIACATNWLAVGSHHGPVLLHNRLAPDEPARALPDSLGARELTFDRLGNLLAIVTSSGGEAQLRLFDLREPDAPPRTVALPARLYLLQFDPSGNYLLGTIGRQVHLYSVPDLSPAAPPRQHQDVVMWAGFAPRGGLYMSAAAGAASPALVSHTNGLSAPPIALPHPHSVTGGDFSSDGRHVLTGCFDRQLRIWDPAQVQLVGEPLRHPAWEDHSSFKIRFLPDGRRAVTLVDDAVRLFDFASHSSTRPPIELPDGPLLASCLSEDGWRMAAATSEPESVAALWELPSGRRLTDRLRHPGFIRQLVLDDTRSQLIALGFDPAQPVPLQGRLWRTDLAVRGAQPTLVATFGNPAAIVRTGEHLHAFTAPGTWFQWHLDRLHDAPIRRELGIAIRRAEASPDHRFIAVLGADEKSLHLFDARSADPVGEPIHSKVEIRQIDFDHSGKLVLTAVRDFAMIPRAATAWSIESGKPIPPSFRHGDGVNAVECHPTRPLVLTGGEDSMVYLWNASDPARVIAEHRMGYQVLDLAFSSDGALYAATGADGTARVWETDSGEPVTPWFRLPVLPLHVFFTPDNNHLVTQCSDGRAYIWDLSPTTRDAEELTQLAHQMKGEHASEAGLGSPLPWRPPLTVDPGAAAAWHRHQAALCERSGDPELTLLHIQHALAVTPEDAALHWRRGLLLESTGRIQDAVAAFRETARADPDFRLASERALALESAQSADTSSSAAR